MSFKTLALLGAMALAVTGCGGGGGGGSSTTSSPTEPAYGASRTPALISENSVQPYLRAALDMSMSDIGFFENGSRMAIPAYLTSEEVFQIRGAMEAPSLLPRPKEKIDETYSCDTGSVRYSGELNEQTGIGSVTQSFNRCVMSGVVHSGAVTINILRMGDGLDSVLDMDVHFSAMRTAVDDVFIEVSGAVRKRNMGSCDQSITYNLAWDMPGVANDVYYKELQQQRVSCDVPALSVAGRIYLGDKGYVDVVTLQPMRFESWAVSNPFSLSYLNFGMISFGNDNGRVEIAASAGSSAYSPTLGTIKVYEDTELVKSLVIPIYYLDDPLLSDLNDSDGDGMLDGWEKYHGLVVGQDDSLEDNDSDGFNNLTEFRGDHNPRSSGETPYIDLAAETVCAADARVNAASSSGQSLSTSINPKFGGTTEPDCKHIYVEVGESVEFNLEVTGQVSELAAASLGHYRVEAELSANGQWSVIDGEGCTIQEASGLTPRLLCEQLPLTAFVGASDMHEHTMTVANLGFRAQDVGDGSIRSMAIWATGQQYFPDYFSIYSASTAATLVVQDQLHVFKVGADSIVYAVFDDRLQGEGEPVGYSFEAHLENPTPGLKFLDPSAVDVNAYDDCVITDFEVSCRYDGNGMDGGISLPLTPATAAGVSTLELEVTTHYRSGASNVHRVQSEVVFGHATEELQGLVSGAKRDGEVVEVDAPDGIYVGPLEVESVIVNASQNFHLYLYEPSASGLSLDVGAATLMLGENSQLSGGNYYLHDRSLVVKNGTTVANASFNMRDARFGVATIEGQSAFVANTFSGKGQDESNIWDWDAAFKLVSGPYMFTLNNNLFKSESRNHHVISNYADGVDVVLMSNTFAKNGRLIDHRSGSSVTYTLVNNVVQEQTSFDVSSGLMYFGNILERPALTVNNNILPARWNGAIDRYERSGNIYTDTPMLDPETFTPLPGSPAIDAGADLSAEFTTDLLGNPRPVGAGFDIGAIEVQAP